MQTAIYPPVHVLILSGPTAKGTHVTCPQLPFLVFTAPISMKNGDRIWVDIRNGHVEMVERLGIAVYRAGWQN